MKKKQPKGTDWLNGSLDRMASRARRKSVSPSLEQYAASHKKSFMEIAGDLLDMAFDKKNQNKTKKGQS